MAGTSPQPLPDPALDGVEPLLRAVEPAPELSRWRQPRDAEGRYVAIERRSLPALTSLRFFAAAYVVVHHLINVGLLATQGADADRAATWYLAWGTQGHVGVTFFFVLSGFILAWCYHHAFATVDPEGLRSTARKFWFARFARVWPLHAAMFLVAVPIALVGISDGLRGLFTTAWQGFANLFLLHAWLPVGGEDGLAQTFNGPSWTLSCEAFFYAIFPLLAVLVLRRLRWGMAQLVLAAAATWLALGALGVLVDGLDRGHWLMHVFPGTRAADFVIGVALGLGIVQHLQRARLAHPDAPRPSTSARWTLLEAAALAATCLSPLVWALAASDVLPETLGSSWFHLPVMVFAIGLMALERGGISRGILAWRPLLWLGEASYALYLTHMVLLVVAYRAGAYDLLGPWVASLLLAGAALVVAGVVHERFEKPVRARLVSRRASRAAAP